MILEYLQHRMEFDMLCGGLIFELELLVKGSSSPPPLLHLLFVIALKIITLSLNLGITLNLTLIFNVLFNMLFDIFFFFYLNVLAFILVTSLVGIIFELSSSLSVSEHSASPSSVSRLPSTSVIITIGEGSSWVPSRATSASKGTTSSSRLKEGWE